ncbi:ABC transporter ATP-binding protein [Cellvibrio japonicus]|uniref:ABC-transport protein, ATP-binding component n=1 Tax=Cellvibrio japonicus (strain Ueda107) TaxID=498211 RepID=B3PJV1_CELJU|nr:ABC transporter ATP-binding protein [Cellvibrio japonicus]ACE85869.1 ABC-transport protein, ATP-binding component [Cellvibrio japonicus Ueda107]
MTMPASPSPLSSSLLNDQPAGRFPGGGGRLGTPDQDGVNLDDDIFIRFDSGIMGRLWGYIRPYRLPLTGCMLAVVLYALVQVAIPLAIRGVVDNAAETAALSTVLPLSTALPFALAIFAVLVLLNFAFNFLQEWGTARIAQRVIFNLRRAMFAHLQQVSLGLLDQTQVGRLMARLQGDVNALQEFMESSISALGDLCLLLGIVVVLLVLDWQLGLLTLAVLPVLVLIRLVWLPWARRQFRRAREASSRVNSALAENINGIRTVQENRRESFNFNRYEPIARENLDAQLGSSRASQIMVPSVDILTGFAMAIVVVAGGVAVLHSRVEVGVMVAYLFYVQRFFDPIRTLSMQYTVLQRAMAAAYRIFEVLDLPVTLQDKPNARVLDNPVPDIEFRAVTFGYKPNQPVLHNISFHIAPYTTAALVGPTGSGKTSITALLHRFYDVWQGQVLIDGQDVRDLTQDSLGHVIGMVLQEPFLFSGSIMDNLRYGSTNASDEEVIAAAKAVRAHDFIERLPQGYQTPLGQRGRNLSIGQRQLLSFARTLLMNPRILILDEATANIDSFTEAEIQRALRVLCAGRTSIIIAHRLATIRAADQILVLNHGRLVEQGNHQQLMQQGGLYYQLNTSNQSSFDELAD